MSDNNILEGLEGLSQEEIADLSARMNKAVNDTKAVFVREAKARKLEAAYRAEMDGLKLGGLSMGQRVNLITSLKRKYRAMGLEVW